MMRRLAGAALICVAAAEPMLTGGQLSLSWTDCGSAHGKTESIEPPTVALGGTTKIVGKGSVDENFAGGTYEVNVKAGPLQLLDHKGDICKADTINLPFGVGSIQWEGLACPKQAGAAEIDMLLTLSGSIPERLARTTITLKATAANGDNLLCVELKTAPANTAQAHDDEIKWSYVQYPTRVDWAMNQTDKVTYTSRQISAVASGANISGGAEDFPPFYLFWEGSAKPYWQYPRYVYHQGFDLKDLVICEQGEWQDDFVKYETGPQFLKQYPKESWTLCQVGADGGLGGGSRWYLYFADVKATAKKYLELHI